jgi:hypothetical protein
MTRAEPKGDEAAEPIPLTIPLDTPEPLPQFSPGQPELERQHQGGLERDNDENWK